MDGSPPTYLFARFRRTPGPFHLAEKQSLFCLLVNQRSVQILVHDNKVSCHHVLGHAIELMLSSAYSWNKIGALNYMFSKAGHVIELTLSSAYSWNRIVALN